jgi:sec-independent protein translocase protein TatA
MPGFAEWLLIGAVVVVLFGAKKLPELARSLGRSSSEFKKGLREGADPDGAAPSPAPPAE